MSFKDLEVSLSCSVDAVQSVTLRDQQLRLWRFWLGRLGSAEAECVLAIAAQGGQDESEADGGCKCKSASTLELRHVCLDDVAAALAQEPLLSTSGSQVHG